MRRREMMTAGGVTLAGLGVLAGFAIGSGQNNPATVASRTQPVEVRTQIIRKTVHVYRRPKPHHAPGGGGRGSSPGSRGSIGAGGVPVAARTRSSGSHVAASVVAGSAPPPVRTHSSGSSAPVRHSTRVSHPVRTSSSGTHHSSGSSHPVTSHPVKTRTSGGASRPSSGASKPVKTRSSGGHGDGGDGGDGGGHDN
jgi:hypothetical protein